MKPCVMNDENFSLLIERINELDLSSSEKRDAVEALLRGERIASLFHALGAGMKRLALAASGRLSRRIAASVSKPEGKSEAGRPQTPALT